MVQYGARPSLYWCDSAVCGSAEFAVLRGDVVESGESYVEPEFLKRAHQPEIAEPV